jgi:hypothetical protein
MSMWDPVASERLSEAVEAFSDNGFVGLAQEAAADTWRANRERYEPEVLFDDPTTLGLQSSRNFSNRMLSYLVSEKRLGHSGVSAAREQGAVVVKAAGFDLRFVKAPMSSGRQPDFDADFDWSVSATRRSAAVRNARSYTAPPREPNMDPLFLLIQPEAAERVRQCSDVFLIWGGDMESGLTGGWLGLPTASANPWLAMRRVWWDEGVRDAAVSPSSSHPGVEVAFRDAEVRMPVLRLKRPAVEQELQ